ncbi:MAG: ribose 5-phosphate isomerase B [Candidatus Electryoneaceae bacterium]|nr:ribose 5-phosphate isomerase B [Candidatus Electryoneaceae bacterium]
MERRKIAIGSDHAGYRLKETIKKLLTQWDQDVVDFGTDSGDRSCDYPDYGRAVAQEVAGGGCDLGVLMCGTGIGMSIVANKVSGIYAALCNTGLQAEYSRRHNNANILVMGGRLIGELQAEEILDRWLNAEFEGGRHIQRIAMIERRN